MRARSPTYSLACPICEKRRSGCACAARVITCAHAPKRCGRLYSTRRPSSWPAATSRTSSGCTDGLAFTTTRIAALTEQKRIPLARRCPEARPSPLDLARPPVALAEEAARGRAVHAARRIRSRFTRRQARERGPRGNVRSAHHRREAARRRRAAIPERPEPIRWQRVPAVSLRRGPLGLRPRGHRVRGRGTSLGAAGTNSACALAKAVLALRDRGCSDL